MKKNSSSLKNIINVFLQIESFCLVEDSSQNDWDVCLMMMMICAFVRKKSFSFRPRKSLVKLGIKIREGTKYSYARESINDDDFFLCRSVERCHLYNRKFSRVEWLCEVIKVTSKNVDYKIPLEVCHNIMTCSAWKHKVYISTKFSSFPLPHSFVRWVV